MRRAILFVLLGMAITPMSVYLYCERFHPQWCPDEYECYVAFAIYGGLAGLLLAYLFHARGRR